MGSNIKKITYDIVEISKKKKISHLTNYSDKLSNRQVKFDNKELIDFSLCDYLGLSTNQDLIEKGCEYLRRNGTYSAVSRTYMKLAATEEAENYLSKIFKKPCIVIPRTTLAHQATLPVIINKEDAVILDHQVHTSVGFAAQVLKADGVKLDVIRHNNLEKLEEKIIHYSKNHQKVWYLADGVYSMYGDTLPIDGLYDLLDKYEKFHLYVDDAHGMSWIGENGRGFALSEKSQHEKMFLVTSLGKGFGSGGSAIVCPNEETKDYIVTLGVPLMFTSPVSPQTLGSIIASAEIHLSEKITKLQSDLKAKIDLIHNLAEKYQLPLIEKCNTPISYFAAGKPITTYEIVEYLQKKSIYVTGGVYPAVPFNNAGVRIMSTLHHKDEDIESLMLNLREAYDFVLEKNNLTIENILKNFKS
jgi:7-keto-8-aminopelargonate synthetase-like enzyme